MIIRTKAPLRLGLAGGGTDLSPYCDNFGGYVLNAAIGMYAYCHLELFAEKQVIFKAADRKQEFASESLKTFELDGYLDLHKAVYNRIVNEFNNGEPISCKLTTYTDAPPGSGLGSSSTLVVAMVKAFVELLRLPFGEYDIAHLAYEIERIDAGLSGGKQDQYAATFGGFNFMEFYKNDRVIVNPLRIKNWIIDELQSTIVLYYTGTSRESAKIIDAQIRNTKKNESTFLDSMHLLKEDALKMKESILEGDIKRFAQILGRSWETKKKTASLISNPEIDELYTNAIKQGAISGKISGAGGGGFMIFAVDPLRRMELIDYLKTQKGDLVNFHFVKDGTKGWVIR